MTEAARADFARKQMGLILDRRDWDWKKPSWTRELKYPLSSWLLFAVGLAITFFNRQLLPVLAPVCVTLEGVALGSFELFFYEKYPGITLIALLISAGMFITIAGAACMGAFDHLSPYSLIAVGVVGSFALTYPQPLFSGGLGIQLNISMLVRIRANLLLFSS